MKDQIFEKYLNEGETYPDSKAGVIAFLNGPSGANKKFLKNLELEKCKIHPDPSVDGVWAIDNKEKNIRVIVYLKDLDFEEGTLK